MALLPSKMQVKYTQSRIDLADAVALTHGIPMR